LLYKFYFGDALKKEIMIRKEMDRRYEKVNDSICAGIVEG